MRQTMILRSVTCSLGAVLVLAGSAPAGAANLACKPNVEVTNKKPASIKVLNFKYKVAGSNEIHTEGLANKKLAPQETEDWKHQKLGHAATGIVVTSTAIEYKDDNSGAGDGYGSPRTSDWFPHTFTCGDDHHYQHTIQ